VSEMTRRSILLVAAVALGAAAAVAAAGPSLQRGRLGAEALRQARARQPEQVALARAHLEARREALGLGAADTLTVRQSFTNGDGEAVVQLTQRHAEPVLSSFWPATAQKANIRP
jgi:hypothetical protein